jgi:hypothetical protein
LDNSKKTSNDTVKMSAIDSVVIVYTNRDFNGNPITLAQGRYDYYKIADQLKINDSIKSIKIPPGYTVTVWEHNRQGKTTTFKADTPYVGDEFSNIISSVEVVFDEKAAQELIALYRVVKTNGTSSSIITPKSPVNGLSAFTVEVWVKPFSLKEGGFFHQHYVLEFSIRNGKIFYWVMPTEAFKQSNIVSGSVDAPISTNEWHHVALVGDGTNVYIYFDGKIIKTVGVTLSKMYGSSSNPFYIGNGFYNADSCFFLMAR